jgi:tRNA (guanine37-N1)-methyltransferase
MSKGVKILAKDTEKTRRKLLQLGLLDTSKKIKKIGDYTIIPVIEPPAGFTVVETSFERVEKIKGFKERLKEFLPEGKSITSFDIIGDLAILEIPDELEEYEEKIAESLLLAHKNIKAVYKKASKIEGTKRIRALKLLCGEPRTETIYKEHGILLKLDISKVYFSPRLSFERERILKQVRDGEVIVDLFAGIGPFSILLAKYRDVKVYAIDINPTAYQYLTKNIRINKVGHRVIPLLGDCREVAPRNSADRVIMNLPKSSHEFLDLAFNVIRRGTIHFYSISPEQDLYSSKIELIKEIGRNMGREIEIRETRIVRPYSPYHYHIAIDIEVK